MRNQHEALIAIERQLFQRMARGEDSVVRCFRFFPYPSEDRRTILVCAELDGGDDIQVLFAAAESIDPDYFDERAVEREFLEAAASMPLTTFIMLVLEQCEQLIAEPFLWAIEQLEAMRVPGHAEVDRIVDDQIAQQRAQWAARREQKLAEIERRLVGGAVVLH